MQQFDNVSIKLTDVGIEITISLGEESGAVIKQFHGCGVCTLYEIPLFGGDEIDCGVFTSVAEAIGCISYWS